MVKILYRTNMEDKRGRGRPQRRWRDEEKELLMGRGLSEREEWPWLEIERLGVPSVG